MAARLSPLLLAAAALITLATACLPKPSDPVDYQRSESAVIVQRKTVQEPLSELDQRATLPDFTLYGDGTLYLTRDGRIVVTRLEGGEIENLLGFIVDRGFLDMEYTLPDAGRSPGQPTTYLYLQTRTGANAVSITLDAFAARDQSSAVRNMGRILGRIDEAADGAEPGAAFVPEAGSLLLERDDDADPSQASLWPIDIELAPIIDRGAPPGSHVYQTAVEAPQAIGLLEPEDSARTCWEHVRQGDLVFDACAVPLLPYMENFAEFETPLQ